VASAPYKASAEDEEETTSERIEAVPPEQAFAGVAASGAPEKSPPKTGVCAFQVNGYDGQDTRSEEKMVVKIKEDRIVHVNYRYRGSYALDGEADVNVPLRENKWTPLEFPMTSGTGKFKVKLDRHGMLFKGTAADTPQADCTWEKIEAEEEKK
jgi:hypothetical protein